MPSGSFKQAYVQCPFYKYDDGRRRITCEGLIDKSSIALIYLTRGDYDKQLEAFCCELRTLGYPIKTDMIACRNRRGRISNFAKYSLEWVGQ